MNGCWVELELEGPSPTLLFSKEGCEVWRGGETGIGFLFSTARLESEEPEDDCDNLAQAGIFRKVLFRSDFADHQPHLPALPSTQQTGRRTTKEYEY